MDIEDVTNPLIRPELTYPIAEFSDDQPRLAEKDERHRLTLPAYNEEVRRRKAEDNAKFIGLQIGDIDKNLKSQLYLALGREGQNCFSHKNPGKEYWIINSQNFGSY